MLFNRDTVDRTKEAVEKWERIVFEGSAERDCALCGKFAYKIASGEEDENCRGCPIWEFTGLDCSDLEEYQHWRNYTNFQEFVYDKESYQLALNQLNFVRKIFIKTLLFKEF